MSDLHVFLDVGYNDGGRAELARRLDDGAAIDERAGPLGETPLHVATRRRRLDAVECLVDRGADVDAANAAGKTAYAHALRRTFDEVAEFLASRGADTSLAPADRLARLVTTGRLDEARALLAEQPGLARTGNPEEDRLLADVAGRMPTEPVALLIEAGADLAAPGLDGATPLHQTAWFGQPQNARLLVEAGAPLHVRCVDHRYLPLNWAAHGSRWSGDAQARADAYHEVVRLLLDAGAAPDASTSEGRRDVANLFEDATPAVAAILREAGLEAPR